MEVVLGILILPLFALGVVGLGRWILGPIDQAARARNAPVRFSIADFLCLFIVIQIPLAAAYQFANDEQSHGYFIFFTILTWIVAPLIWIAATRALSKAGVSSGKYRWMFMGLVVPLAYYGLIPFVIMTLVGPAILITRDSTEVAGFGWYVVVWFVLGALLYLSGRFTNWLVLQAEPARLGESKRPLVDLEGLDDAAGGE